MKPSLQNVLILASLVPEVFAEFFFQSWGIGRRSNTTQTLPSPIVVPPSQYWDGDDGQWSSFAIRVGSPAQDVRVLVSTNSPETMVVFPEGCTTQAIDPVPNDCSNSRGGLFNTSASTTWKNQGLYGINQDGIGYEANLGYSQNADYGLEMLGLGYTAGASGPTLQNQTVAGIATTSPFYMGVLGLSTQPVNYSSVGNYSAPSYFKSLRSQQLIPSLSWSYTAGAKYRLKAGQYAQLIFGGFDTSRFTPNSASFTLAGDINRDIVIAIQSITYTGAIQKSLLATPIYAFIESTDVNLWLPEAACQAFESAFGLSLDNSTGLYLINATQYTFLLSANPQVTFLMANSLSGGETASIVFPFSAFALSASYPFTQNDTYYFPLRKAANETQYTLGRTFLQEAYLTVDYESGNFSVSQCTWNDGAASQISAIISSSYDVTSGSGSSSSSSDTKNITSTHVGAGVIAGAAIGSTAVIGLVGLGIFFFLRSRTRRRAEIVAAQGIALAQINPSNEDKKGTLAAHPPATPSPPYKDNEATSVYRPESPSNELPNTGEIYQLPSQSSDQEGDYESLAKRMENQKTMYNRFEIDGMGVSYELEGDGPGVMEMDDERSRRGLLTSTPSEAGRTRGGGPEPGWEKFTIEGSNIWFLDPRFSDTDIDFLKRRGYAAAARSATLGSHSESGCREAEGYSKEMLASITTSTLFMAFGLEADVSMQFICAGKPYLYFGNEPVASTAFAPLHHLKSKVHDLIPKFETFAFLRGLLAVDMYAWDEDEAREEDCGLMWEVGVKDEVWEARTQKRLMKAVESWKWWDESIKGIERKREEKKRSKRDKQFSPF